jgi:hypothetical protein
LAVSLFHDPRSRLGERLAGQADGQKRTAVRFLVLFDLWPPPGDPHGFLSVTFTDAALRRAFSMRMRRMGPAAAAKKWPRQFYPIPAWLDFRCTTIPAQL